MIYMILQLSLLPITGEQDTSVCIPANIRDMIDTDSANSLCPGFDSQFGLYMGDIQITLPSFKRLGMSTGKINWDVARSVQKQLEIKKKEAAMIFNFLKFIDGEKFIKNQQSKHRAGTFEISNLGSYKNDPEDTIKIIDMIFSEPVPLGSGYFCCSVTGTDIGGVNLALAGVKDLQDEFKLFCDGVGKWIETLVTDS